MDRSLEELRAGAEQLIYTAGRALAEYGHVLRSDRRAQVEQALETLKGLMDSDNASALQLGIKNLEELALQVAIEMGEEGGEDA